MLLYYLCRIVMCWGYAAAVVDGMSTLQAVFYGAREANWAWRAVLSWKAAGRAAFFLLRIWFGLALAWYNTTHEPSWWGFIGGFIGAALLTFVAWRNLFKVAYPLREKARSELR